MNTKNLETILASAESANADRKVRADEVAAIGQERDAVIEAATGPKDTAALDKLNVLASRERIANSKLQICDRQIAGLSPTALNEALFVREKSIAELAERKAAIMAKAAKSLTELYPDAADREAALELLNSRKQPPGLRRISKVLGGLHGASFQPRQITELEFARLVFQLASQANDVLAAAD